MPKLDSRHRSRARFLQGLATKDTRSFSHVCLVTLTLIHGINQSARRYGVLTKISASGVQSPGKGS